MGSGAAASYRKELSELRSLVREHPLDAPILDYLLAPLGDALGFCCGFTYQLAPSLECVGWDFRYLATTPRSYISTVRREYGPFLRTSPTAAGSFHPLRPERSQRNRVLTLGQIRPTAATERLFEEVYPRAGVGGMDQLRVLLCDGPRLQAWLGGFRQEPFRERERRVLRGLVPTLVERLRLEEALRATDVMERGLETALGLLGAPAFLVDDRARLAVASDAGVELLDSDARGTRERLLGALRGCGAGDTVVPVRRVGHPSWHLVVLRSPGAVMEVRVARAARFWSLTRRQTDVLSCLARGDANKTIADKLDCVVGTIELHVSAILAKAGVESRSALVAQVWQA